ncbi:hypothetical protein [Paenibacillus mucilaginosus]|uniref:hypothetical protein n=1 Tax=Paenibacillus mucilaginosus TaxID=61624 RepID=UPI001EE6920F|nr:hypothetical protein [Paenibacillus mucilaginosus]
MTTASKMKRMWSTFTAITMLSSVLFMVPAAQAATLYADSQLGANDGWGSRTGTGTTSFTLNGGKSTTSTETPGHRRHNARPAEDGGSRHHQSGHSRTRNH